MQNESQRRIITLLHLLLEQTDERHYVTGADILRFWEAHDIHASRKNVYSDTPTGSGLPQPAFLQTGRSGTGMLLPRRSTLRL